MAEEAKKAEEGAEAAPTPKKRKIEPMLILPIVNAVAVILVLGFAAYSKLIFKRPPIVEKVERKKAIDKAEAAKPDTETGIVVLPAITVNIGHAVKREESDEASQRSPSSIGHDSRVAVLIKGRLHYATVKLSLEIQDMGRQKTIEALQPVILDKLGTTLAKKDFHELTNIQGRYVLRQEIIDMVNKLMADTLVTNVYFAQFIVQ